MPLLIANSSAVESDFDSTRSLFANFPHLKDQTRELFNAAPDAVQTFDCERDPVLYVMQGETAIVMPSDETIEILLTDDTTTCITGIIRHRASGVTCLTHYDRPLEDNLLRECLEAVLDKMAHLGSLNGAQQSSSPPPSMSSSNHQAQPVSELSPTAASNLFDLYLIGGYADERNISEDLAIYLLRTFHSLSRFTINLACAFTGHLNTKGIQIGSGIRGEALIPAPIVYGAAINLKTGRLMNATLNRQTDRLSAGIPLLNLRRATVSFGTSKMYRQIYEPERRRLVISPLSFDSVESDEALEYFLYILKLNDQMILKKFSTSPYVEPAHFVSDFRGTFEFFIQYHKQNIGRLFFPTGKPRYYRHYQLLRSTTTNGNSTNGHAGSVQYRWKPAPE